MKVSLSVIVPVYNVERYLDECVQSILGQDYRDFEVILVDDGSTDQSGAICDGYAQKDTRVRVIHQKNGGQSAARNKGVAAARGEWLAFVDSDDVIPEGAFAGMMAKAAEGVDVIIGRAGVFRENVAQRTMDPTNFTGVDPEGLSGAAVMAKLAENSAEPLWAPWRNYFRRSYWQELPAQFVEGITNEDMQLIPRVQIMAKGIALYDREMYCYRQARPNSTMTKKNLKRD